MKPFNQEFERIETNLNDELLALADLRDNHGYDELQPVVENLGKALIALKDFNTSDEREGCNKCSKPITNNYVVIDGEKYCNDCAKQKRKQNNIWKYGR